MHAPIFFKMGIKFPVCFPLYCACFDRMGVTEVTLSSLMHFSTLKRRSTQFLRRFAGEFFCRSPTLPEPAVGSLALSLIVAPLRRFSRPAGENKSSMALYHFTVKNDKRPKTKTQISAVEHSDYINREGKFKNIDERQPQSMDNVISSTRKKTRLMAGLFCFIQVPTEKSPIQKKGLSSRMIHPMTQSPLLSWSQKKP